MPRRSTNSSNLESLIASRFAYGDFAAFDCNVRDFLTEVKLAEMEFDPERYGLAYEEFWALVKSDKEALISVTNECDYLGILDTCDAGKLMHQLEILFPK